MVNVGFVGVGGIAQRHIRSLEQLGGNRMVAFCDAVAERAAEAAAKHGGTAYTDMERMLEAEAEALDAVFLCTPPFVRAEPIEAIAGRGIAVFSEKPPAFDLSQGRRALAAIRASGVISNVGFMYRWMEIVTRARDLMEGRRLSAVRSVFLNGPAVELHLPGWFYLQERSGGPLLDQAIHLLDLHRFFAGEVTSVYALGNNRIQPKSDTFTIEDTHTLSLTFASGVIGSHTHSWTCRPGRAEVELISDEARLDIDLFANRLWGVVDGKDIDFTPGDDCYVTEVQHFLAAVEQGDPGRMRSPYADGLRTATVTWAALESVAAGAVRAPSDV